MDEKRVYRRLPDLTREQVRDAIHNNDVDTLVYAAFSTATYDQDWKYAQDLCIRLSEHPHKIVRGNAVLALGDIARIHRKLEKHLVTPILLRALNDSEAEVRGLAEDAIDDINTFLLWRIGDKHETR